jgi:hypothetical protein
MKSSMPVTEIRVHWNLHKHCYSVVDIKTGRVVEHTVGPIYLEKVRFVAQPAGRARVLREKRKNVHAYVRGSRLDGMPASAPAVGGTWPSSVPPMPIHYNPYTAGHWWWLNPDTPVDGAVLTELTTDPETGRAVVNMWGPLFRLEEAA